MVKLGVIVEGDSDKIILDRSDFKDILNENEITLVDQIVNVGGVTKLNEERIKPYLEILTEKGAEKILVLGDLDDKPCISSRKQVIDPNEKLTVIVTVKQIETWFLADTNSMSSLLKSKFICERPEEVEDPFNFIKEEGMRLWNRGVSDKKILARKMIYSGFTIKSAGNHPNCFSAQYFLKEMQKLKN